MFRWLTALSLMLFAQGLLGCAHTRIVSERDPNVPDDYYGSVLVDAQLATMPQSVESERRAAELLRARGYRAFAEGEVLFTQREYTRQQTDAALDAKRIDAILVIRLRDQGFESQYVPGTVTQKTKVEETDGGYTETVTMTSTEDQAIELAWGIYVAELYDRHTGELVWYAEAETKGSGAQASLTGSGQDHDDLARVVAKEVAGQLHEDRVLRPVAELEEELREDGPFEPARLRNR